MKRVDTFNSIYILTKKIILLLVVFVFFLRCSSNEQAEESVYPSNLVLRAYEVTSSVKVYTKDGEVKDSKLVSNFLKTYSINTLNSESFELQKGFVELDKTSDTINYISKDFVFFKNADSKIEKAFGNRVPKMVGNEIYFYPKDTLFQQFYPFAGDFKDIISELGNYKPYFKKLSLSFEPDNSQFSLYKSFEAFIAKGNTTELEFPYLNYYISRTNNEQRSWKSAKFMLNNTFDKNVIKLLKLGDTLAIQEVKKIYKKY